MRRKFLTVLICVLATVLFAQPTKGETFTSPVLSLRVFLPIIKANYSPPAVSAKKGIAANYLTWQDWQRTGSTWGYQWLPQAPVAPTGIEMVPMIRDSSQLSIPVTGASPYLLVLNEPERPDQGNATPHEGAILFHQVRNLYPNRKLVSPTTVIDESWLPLMRSEYHALYGSWPQFEAIAIHCYYWSVDKCKRWTEKAIGWANEWGVVGGVWVTEFALVTPDQVANYAMWLENNPAVRRYAFYTNRTAGGEFEPGWSWNFNLADHTDGELTPIGRAYATVGD